MGPTPGCLHVRQDAAPQKTRKDFMDHMRVRSKDHVSANLAGTPSWPQLPRVRVSRCSSGSFQRLEGILGGTYNKASNTLGCLLGPPWMESPIMANTWDKAAAEFRKMYY